LYDLPAEGETTKKAANATCTYFNGGTYVRQPGVGVRHRNAGSVGAGKSLGE